MRFLISNFLFIQNGFADHTHLWFVEIFDNFIFRNQFAWWMKEERIRRINLILYWLDWTSKFIWIHVMFIPQDIIDSQLGFFIIWKVYFLCLTSLTHTVVLIYEFKLMRRNMSLNNSINFNWFLYNFIFLYLNDINFIIISIRSECILIFSFSHVMIDVVIIRIH